MKKLLLSIFSVVLSLGAFAQTEVTFDFDNDATTLFGIEGRSSSSSSDGDITENVMATIDGVNVIVSPSTTATANRLWNASPVLRMYGGTLTVSAAENITKVVFNAGNKFGINSADSGTIESKTWTASTDVTEVVFTISSNTQLKSMTVTIGGTPGEDPDPVVLDGTGEGTAASPYDVTRALSVIANGVQTTDKVYIAGTVSEISEYSVDYGNATYNITDGQKEILVYRGKYYNDKMFTEEGQIKLDDELVLCGVLVDYNGTSEIKSSYIVTINGVGAPEEPAYVPVGDGSRDNPYTVEDIQGMDIQESDGNSYWVKGYILGSATSATKLNNADKAVDTNIALGETPDATSFIPVALPATGDIRTKLGVATNPDNVGKIVYVYGTLDKYFSVAGVKNVTEWWSDEISGIENVSTDSSAARYYNIQGVEVTAPVAGQLYIRVQGGKATKVLVK